MTKDHVTTLDYHPTTFFTLLPEDEPNYQQILKKVLAHLKNNYNRISLIQYLERVVGK